MGIVAKRLWQVAISAAVAVIGVAAQAEAAVYYWQDSEPGLSRPTPAVPQRRLKTRRQPDKKSQIADKEAKPQGPLIISISIAQQKMRIYDSNGFFAETPVSTGMPGHPTPMGVFSVIQKQKLHHSNIYSGAPMPFMQRITWSGVAMHAGVLPGHPASHGCIRMPMAFAVKMWNWTKMGARVVITPGDITPASFSHPLLATVKVPPQPIAAEEPKPDAPPVAQVQKATEVEAAVKPAVAETKIELRSTIGHEDNTPPQTRTADASDALPATNQPITMSDAPSASAGAPTAAKPAIADKDEPPKPEAAKSEAEQDTPKREEAASSDDKPAAEIAEAKSPEAAVAEVKPAEAVKAEPAKIEPVAAEPAASETIKPAEAKVEAKEAKADEIEVDPPKASAEKSAEKPAEDVKAAAAPAATPESKTDQTRASDAVKPASSKIDPAVAPKRSGQIAVFISRKDSKLYVRQNFSPLFDVRVTIAPDERPLGTHIFTAQVDKADANVLHWSVVSLPPPTRYADRRDEDERNSHKRKGAAPVAVKPLPIPDSPAEALDRLSLPADTMARIFEALSTGGSIVVSDQGIAAGETGEGTDFIVSLR
jgi:lipoprotein-anchoring transpeptidase ErfK/SrfK